MSDSELNNELSNEFCAKCRDDFVRITNTDHALAMYYLADNNYDLNIALEKFNENDHILHRGFYIPITKENNDLKHLIVLSWNLQGLEEKDFQRRINTAIKVIKDSDATIVLLQEMVEKNELEIRKKLENTYHIFIENGPDKYMYYCGILVKKHPDIKVDEESFQTKTFSNTTMGRQMLTLNAHFSEIPVKIITAHLESTKDFSAQRKKQLKTVFKEMRKDVDFSIFAGDLNLRDREIAEIGGIPDNIVDVWEATGKRKEIKLTWDPKRNLNANLLCPIQFGLRFDRMYFYSKSSVSRVLWPVFFRLEGLKKIEGGQRFPSDHWAIVGHFDLQ